MPPGPNTATLYSMPDILLSTLNAKYLHAAFGLRYLMANLGALRPRAQLLEFDINQRPVDIAEGLLAADPKIIGLGIYLWNVAPATEVAAIVKRLRPDIRLVLGGPEISFETEVQPISRWADYIITGEADLAFSQLCQQLLEGAPPPGKLIPAPLPDPAQLAMPYEWYDEQDIARRIIYVEASRGCPFSCEFCLSSLDIPVRRFPLPALLEQLQSLLDRGATQLKFVDRTFNLDLEFSRALLEFLLARYQPGRFFHFEMVPDRLPPVLREIIRKFPAGALQFEVGVQTFDPEVGERIHRRQNYERMEDNFRFLRRETGVHLHADLIVGLPGESMVGFADGFDRLIGLAPHEIQVGILKRLRGTPITRHNQDWAMVYNQQPPYELLQNKSIDFASMQLLRRFARHWDLVGNSGNFVETAPLIWSVPVICSAPSSAGGTAPEASRLSPFYAFLQFSRWLQSRVGRTDGIALVRLMELLFKYLTDELELSPTVVAPVLWRDYQRGGRPDKPTFLRPYLLEAVPTAPREPRSSGPPKRQARHGAGLPLASGENRDNFIA